jgi:hypothetical protein
MLQQFSRWAGAAQAAFGAFGVASADVSSAVGTQDQGNIFNILSGAALGYLGMKATPAQMRYGVPAIAALNGIVGLLGAFGVHSILGFELNESLIANIVNIGICAAGFALTYWKRKDAKKREEEE